MFMYTTLLISYLFLCCEGDNAINLPPPCDNLIYCHGEFLQTIQLARLYNDSKTFVDKKMIHPPDVTLQNFEQFMNITGEKPDKKQIEDFINNHFIDGDELEYWSPPDFNPNPTFVKEIVNTTVQNFTQKLISLWPLLTRRMKAAVVPDLDRYSFIPVPNGFVVPGGRFRESYYWDSYWIIKGLLLSEMSDTAKGMVDNFISLVKRYGFIPNGGRVYYLNRSQPPLLTAMAYNYYKHTNNTKWLKENIASLAQELRFWLENRLQIVQVSGENFTLAHYFVKSTGPRPESYAEDFLTAASLNKERQQHLYVNLKSGAESGWDFSSRWFFDEEGGNVANLTYIDTGRVIPVDLNAFLCGAFQNIAQMYMEIGDVTNNMFWLSKAAEWRKAIASVLWNEEDGIWYDYDTTLSKPRKYFYPSSAAPLWARCYEQEQGQILGDKVAKYFKKMGILDYLGGIPTSLVQTGEQWDLPYAWPPLQDIVVEGLQSSGSSEAQELAEIFARRWVNANILGFVKSGEMFEKYDAIVPGQYGGGGEYKVQTGFGWSNGVVLKFIYEYFRNR